VRITVAHLYPDRLNIYADRGNMAVLRGRGMARGIDVIEFAVDRGDPLPTSTQLVYVGGGQDRDQAFVASDLAARGGCLADLVAGGVPVLAVCGGYQLLGRSYRGRDGEELFGAGVFPLETHAGEGRLIGDVLLECTLPSAAPFQVAGFENHVGRTVLDDDAVPLGRVLHGFGNNGEDAQEGCRLNNAIGTYLHGPLLPRNPSLADWILERAAEAGGSSVEAFTPLPDDLERNAFTIASERAAQRGGRS